MKQREEKEYIEVRYRKLETGEAEKFWELMNTLDFETSFMMYEPGERTKNLESLEELIKRAEKGIDFLVVAEINTELVGYLLAQRGEFHRTEHTAYLVAGIREKYCDRGIGTQLFERLNIWARENKIRRLELTVMCGNSRARHLYEKSGFNIEGVKKNSLQVNGKYVDEYYMAKLQRECE